MFIKEERHSFQSSVAFHIETIYVIYVVNQITGFYIKLNSELKLVNPLISNLADELLSVFDHFVEFALNGLTVKTLTSNKVKESVIILDYLDVCWNHKINKWSTEFYVNFRRSLKGTWGQNRTPVFLAFFVNFVLRSNEVTKSWTQRKRRRTREYIKHFTPGFLFIFLLILWKKNLLQTFIMFLPIFHKLVEILSFQSLNGLSAEVTWSMPNEHT